MFLRPLFARLFLAARLLRQLRQILGRAHTSGPRGGTGTGATDVLGQAITASTPGTDTSTIILGMAALAPTTRAGTETNFNTRLTSVTQYCNFALEFCLWVDTVEKRFLGADRATLIQERHVMRNIDSRTHPPGVKSCAPASRRGLFQQHRL